MKYSVVCVATILLVFMLVMSIGYAATVSSLVIHVLRSDEPVANAVVELWANKTLITRAVTGTDGAATLSNITAGKYTIYVYINGTVYRFDRVIDTNTTELNLTLSGTEGAIANVKTITSNWYIAVTVGGAFILILLIAYALSGTRYPRRR